MAMQDYLDQEIKKICPIQGISFPDLNDKSGWRIDFDPTSTPEQQQVAIQYIENFVWSDDLQQKQIDDALIAKYKDDLSVKAGYVQYKLQNPNAVFLDYLKFLESLTV